MLVLICLTLLFFVWIVVRQQKTMKFISKKQIFIFNIIHYVFFLIAIYVLTDESFSFYSNQIISFSKQYFPVVQNFYENKTVDASLALIYSFICWLSLFNLVLYFFVDYGKPNLKEITRENYSKQKEICFCVLFCILGFYLLIILGEGDSDYRKLSYRRTFVYSEIPAFTVVYGGIVFYLPRAFYFVTSLLAVIYPKEGI